MTSKSTVTVTKAFYHRKDVSITINKAGTPSTPWYGTDTKIILKDTSSTPAKEYVLEAEKTGDPLTPTGNYTGNIPDGDYEIIIQNNTKQKPEQFMIRTIQVHQKLL